VQLFGAKSTVRPEHCYAELASANPDQWRTVSSVCGSHRWSLPAVGVADVLTNASMQRAGYDVFEKRF
jgi:hypothetical protein